MEFSLPVWANPTVYAPATRSPEDVNVILLSIDTLRADHLTSYGYAHDTAPFIDARLARRGVVFESLTAASPVTAPSHMTMFTALQPITHGVTHGLKALSPALRTLPELLRAHRIETAAFTENGWVGTRQGFGRGWQGGSCRALAFLGGQIMAATHRAGVLRLPAGRSDAEWQPLDVRCGLPLRDPGRFHPVDTVAADAAGELVLAGGLEGVHRSRDGGVNYEDASRQEFQTKVTLPPTWLFCSGAHEVSVVSQDEAERD